MKAILLLGAGILAGLCILGITLILVSHLSRNGSTVSLKQHPSSQSSSNCSEFPLAIGCAVAETPINICSTQYVNYPPPSDILTTPANPNLGVYEGTISKLNEGLQSITVSSSRSGKAFVFNRGSVNGYTYDIHHSIVKYFYTLHTGTKAVVSFPCSQKLGIFNLNQFQIVQ